MRGDWFDVTGQVAEGEVFEHGVGREHRGRQHGGFHPHRRNDRQRHGERTLADAGNILNGYDSFHGIDPFLSP
ncbi:hypothetical protein SDC9_163704 [bioreactor metagenome]|uniref:Uncharacterized protein n=1 Tax=bioreactor metagenome TaxID=1076179 RepID=A0A645FPK8_9ZZZZ